MSAYHSKTKRIKNALKTVLESIQYDSGSGPENAFAQVLDNNRMVFRGWPNVQILPGDLANERPTAHQAQRTPDYIIRIRMPLEDTDQQQSDTYDHMYDLREIVSDTIDEADQSGRLNQIDPTLGTFLLTLGQGEWSVVESNAGDILLTDINVSVSYSKDLG